MSDRQWHGGTGGGALGQRALILFLRFFSFRIGYAAVALIAPFYMLISWRNCRAIYRYFRQQHGCRAVPALLKTYRNHFIFGQVILDRFTVFAGKRHLFTTEVIGMEHFNRLLDSSRGFIMAGSHIGNFEIGGYLLHQQRKRINALVYAGESRVVQLNRSKALGSNNISLIPVLDDLSHLFSVHAALERGETVSMPCDRIHGSPKSLSCRFLRGTAKFPIGPFAVASRMNVEMLAIYVLKTGTRKYTVHVIPITPAQQQASATGQAKTYLENYVRATEQILLKYPEQWFNYYEFWEK
ncbi:MAG: lipid A biosynthesis (KDO)2-(lauroyl)-lipid IVA acyltransferase [Bacteroidales bacterium]|jgi:predicted LPLAT superfamily acyltransferase|nr:lipid A biosynthesis (KDO)2-(lauroyl)-lipid IVA acyltransferase [Bacteroidales bacterium]